MKTVIQEKKIDPQIFRLFMKIKSEITPPFPLNGMTRDELVALIVDEIKDTSRQMGTPIIRKENKFYIYNQGEPIFVPNKAMEEFIGWIGKYLGIDQAIVYEIPFRQCCFGRAWRVLYTEG